jgi:hypothetical protein
VHNDDAEVIRNYARCCWGSSNVKQKLHSLHSVVHLSHAYSSLFGLTWNVKVERRMWHKLAKILIDSHRSVKIHSASQSHGRSISGPSCLSYRTLKSSPFHYTISSRSWAYDGQLRPPTTKNWRPESPTSPQGHYRRLLFGPLLDRQVTTSTPWQTTLRMTDQGARRYSGPEATSVPRLATGWFSTFLSPLLLRSACPELRPAAGLILSFPTELTLGSYFFNVSIYRRTLTI